LVITINNEYSYYGANHSLLWVVTVVQHLHLISYWLSTLCTDITTE